MIYQESRPREQYLILALRIVKNHLKSLLMTKTGTKINPNRQGHRLHPKSLEIHDNHFSFSKYFTEFGSYDLILRSHQSRNGAMVLRFPRIQVIYVTCFRGQNDFNQWFFLRIMNTHTCLKITLTNKDMDEHMCHDDIFGREESRFSNH